MFPKDYPFNTNEPLHWVFEPGSDGKPDFDRPNPVAFRHFETQIARLRDLGIEADVIIFHPYDRWGYCDMSAEQDFRYVAYLAARLGAYRNVWWSLANEYDFLLDTKPMAQWDRYFHILQENDPNDHLRSIHNGDVKKNYDHTKPWVSHVCIQNWGRQEDSGLARRFRQADHQRRARNTKAISGRPGAISALRNSSTAFGRPCCAVAMPAMGETYAHPEDIIWWGQWAVSSTAKPGSASAFCATSLNRTSKAVWPRSAAPIPGHGAACPPAEDGDVRYIYFGEHQPAQWTTGPADRRHAMRGRHLIDTWNMTITPAEAHRSRHPASHTARRYRARWQGGRGIRCETAGESPIWRCACGKPVNGAVPPSGPAVLDLLLNDHGAGPNARTLRPVFAAMDFTRS